MLKKLTLIILLFPLLASCKVDEGRGMETSILANPIDVAFPTTDYMYVSNANSLQEFFTNASISVLNVSNPLAPFATGAFVSTPLFNGRMAVNNTVLPNMVFVTNRFTPNSELPTDAVFNLSYTDPAAPTISRTYHVPVDPFGIDIIPSGPHAGTVMLSHVSGHVVSYFDATQANPTINIINISTPLAQTVTASNIAISPDSAWAAVSSTSSNLIYIIDLTPPYEFTLEAVLQVSNAGYLLHNFRDIVWTDNTHFVAANRAAAGLVLFDLNTINHGDPLVDTGSTNIITVDTTGHTGVSVVRMLPFGDPAALAKKGNLIFVAESSLNQVRSVDLTSFGVSLPIPVYGSAPDSLRFAPDGVNLYVCNQASSNIGIIDTDKRLLVGHFP